MYALDDVNDLLSKLPSNFDVSNPVVRYLGAIFAELAYYHVPQWEVDDRRRALLVPCDAHQDLVRSAASTDVQALIRQAEISEARVFILEDRGVIVVGVLVRRVLFMGFRGTQFLFDWPINLRSSKIRLQRRFVSAKLHKGFATEAMRISAKIRQQLSSLKNGDFDHVLLSGHSLGGAVAAISALLLPFRFPHVITMGAPRYGNWAAYINPCNPISAQVRRAGDGVPTVPPRWLGYADHPLEVFTNGRDYRDPLAYSGLTGSLFRWIGFLARRVRPHSMECYRKEMGIAAGAPAAHSDLAPYERLSSYHLEQPPPQAKTLVTVVYLQAGEAARWEFKDRITKLTFVEAQSRYVRPDPDHPEWACFAIFASQMPSDDYIQRVADDLGVKILRIEPD